MKPILIEGNSIAEVWENALIALQEKGVKITTQYDFDPNTGVKNPPSIDSPLIMFVEDALAEPRLHVCLEGGPAELAEYKLEVVNGIKNHWVKLFPEGTEWTYTYNGRLTNYGGNMNFATSINNQATDPKNPWVQLAYVKKNAIESDNVEKFSYENILPVNQINYIIDTLSETPYSRRAVALTSFPPADILVSDPPCLRYIECRGYSRNNCIYIDMNVHFRSRDAWGAALFNMYALTELQKYITEQIQLKMKQKAKTLLINNEYRNYKCPYCGEKSLNFISENNNDSEEKLFKCNNCNIYPFIVKTGTYTDISDSFHIYGIDMKEFEDRFINSALKQPKNRRFWDLSSSEMQELIAEGEEKAYKTVKSIDKKKDRTGLLVSNPDMIK